SAGGSFRVRRGQRPGHRGPKTGRRPGGDGPHPRGRGSGAPGRDAAAPRSLRPWNAARPAEPGGKSRPGLPEDLTRAEDLTPPAPAGVSGAPGLFPPGSRLTGGQIIGLAVLAAGIIITVARLSARGPRRQRSRNPPAS